MPPFFMILNLFKNILSARNDDVEGWMQILVFVVIAVFWVIKNVFKAVKSNKGQQPADEDEEDNYTINEGYQPVPGSYKIPQEPVLDSPITNEKMTRDDEIISSIKYGHAASDIEQIEKNVEKINISEHYDAASFNTNFNNNQVFEKETTEDFSDRPAEYDSRKDIIEILTAEDNKEDLRNAIVLNEILNKPVSLRNKELL